MPSTAQQQPQTVSRRNSAQVVLRWIGLAAVLCAVNWPAPLAADPRQLLDLSLDELSKVKIDTVFAASKFTEKVTDAPSSVSIVTEDQIQRFGYRTLADIIRSVRSFDITSDRVYSHSGVRGFNSLDGFGSRTLLLIDGHRMNDPILDTAAVGTEALLDVDLIERVEFIRGPGSTIYGSNAFFSVINVVTRSGASVNGLEASTSIGTFDTYTGRVTIGKKLANGLDYLISASVYFSDGQDRLFYRDFNSPTTNYGVASNLDGTDYWSTFAKVSWGDFTLQGGYVARNKDVPTAPNGSVFNVPDLAVNARGYAELRYLHETADGWSISGRLYYDSYDVHTLAYYDYDSGRALNDDSARARWFGAEAGVSRTFFKNLRVAVGAEVRRSIDLTLRNYDEHPFNSYLNVSAEQLVYGAYGDAHLDLTHNLSLTAGVRWDHYDSFGSTVNPRAALDYKPYQNTTIKLLYGEAFRAPNIYQLDYTSFRQRINPNLGPETIRTYEAVLEQYFLTHWRGTVSVFRNEISSLIQTTADEFGFVSFTNADDANVNGAEAEIEGKWDNGLLVRASYTHQEAKSASNDQRLVNSPDNVVKAQLSVPVYRDKIFGSLEFLYSSDRLTPEHARTDDAWTLNGTIYSRNLLPNLTVSASVYNILDQKLSTPVSIGYLQDTITQDGRTFRLKLTYKF
ncbi:MAG: TonB-dependent receptor [Verrucomicrobiota bacterium]|nr:TonB-dependent receptor [Verrucomicrobiota bacterium]